MLLDEAHVRLGLDRGVAADIMAFEQARLREETKERIWRQRPTCSAAQHRVMMMPSSDGTGMEWAIVSSLSTVRMRFRTVLSTVISTMRNAGKWRLTDGAALR